MSLKHIGFPGSRISTVRELKISSGSILLYAKPVSLSQNIEKKHSIQNVLHDHFLGSTFELFLVVPGSFGKAFHLCFYISVYRGLGGAQLGNRFVSFVRAYARSYMACNVMEALRVVLNVIVLCCSSILAPF